ncbi:zinc finger BED domain-containing protein 1-like [Rhizophagus clarus]|uniref:Zinc finger BED domain-containing protein 1-like n=1 Tax=Rhizophagus clarus TaxID=94130 RepID=A0A8H3QDK7_9GLOM|nr:zinc finger BED domain-containing protein 1-like [Rhizophagus clarus]
MKDLSFVSSEKGNEIKNLLPSLRKPSTRSYDEVDEYFQLEEIDLESNSFIWWHEREEKFPILSFLAKKYLSAYACSTVSERLFSDTENLLTAKRIRISPSLFKKLIFLKRNAKHLNSIHKSNNSD